MYCQSTATFGLLQISHIPGIRSVLGKKDSLCQITSASTVKPANGMVFSDIYMFIVKNCYTI